jgi:putative adenylate-forming enzyme
MNPAFAILGAYAAKRWTLARLRTRQQVEIRQQQLLTQLLAYAPIGIPFYRSYAGKPITAWPVMDKAMALAHFSGLNAHGVTDGQAWQVAEKGLSEANRSGRLGDLTIGTSSGTSGNRGLFLISDAERYQWLGSILARTLPDFPFARHRVAVLLSTGNSLYETTRQSGRLAFGFYDLRKGIEIHRVAMEAFAPDVIVAPPKALRILAEQDFTLKPAHILAGGEVLDPLDAAPVMERYGVAPRSIYQATEGFIGIACRHGMIHLNEDDMLIEREPVPGHPDRVVPIITDLRRRAQVMIRYRLNDILVPSTRPCACGSPLQAIERVEGRCDDVIELPSRGGGRVTVMPDAIRATILDAERHLADFRFDQTGTADFMLRLPSGAPEDSEHKVVTALQALFEQQGGIACKISTVRGINEPIAGKLRRIRRVRSASSLAADAGFSEAG